MMIIICTHFLSLIGLLSRLWISRGWFKLGFPQGRLKQTYLSLYLLHPWHGLSSVIHLSMSSTSASMSPSPVDDYHFLPIHQTFVQTLHLESRAQVRLSTRKVKTNHLSLYLFYPWHISNGAIRF